LVYPGCIVLIKRHCHIDWHVLIGMIAQFVEAPDVLQEITIVPQEIIDQCAVQGINLDVPAANREDVKCAHKAGTESGNPFFMQSSWWQKVVEMWFGWFRV
jgi:Multicopper oxidase